jgi:NAD(P)-dependent dehydrogenase (short-subunit alcohol dehydrogenase family)
MKKTAIVTGSNRGLGLEVARQLARLGNEVCITARKPQELERAQALLQNEGISVHAQLLDVREEKSCEALAAWAQAEWGHVDILVNNAGIFPDDANVKTCVVPLRVLNEGFQTNTLGPFKLCQLFFPGMKKRGYGRIVNVSSGMGQLSEMNGGTPAYRLSKTALNAVTRIFADEAEDTPDLKVNSVCPGWVKTDMGGPDADREIPEGADTLVWAATLPSSGPSGGFFRDREPIEW